MIYPKTGSEAGETCATARLICADYTPQSDERQLQRYGEAESASAAMPEVLSDAQ